MKYQTTMISKIEYITLNIASLGWIAIDVYEYLPTAVTIVVGLSIAFLNIARGVKALREKKAKK